MPLDAEGVKDPVVIRSAGKYYMLLSYAPRPPQVTPEMAREMHATGDVYNTGVTRSCTGLATSTDGREFRWEGEVLGTQEPVEL